MDPSQRLHLDQLLKNFDGVETTDQIRTLKHSKLIFADVKTMEKIKVDYARLRKTNKAEFETIVTSRCSFLFNNYTSIFNKLLKDELDLMILSQFLSVLARIEEGEIDQHEGSVLVGQLLKQLYVDSALKHSEKMDAEYEKENPKKKPTK